MLADSGSIFVQIGDENVHHVRDLMDEVFGEDNFCNLIQVQKTGGQASSLLASTVDFIAWYAKSRETVKYRQLFSDRREGHTSLDRYDQVLLDDGSRRRLKKHELEDRSVVKEGIFCREQSLISAGSASSKQIVNVNGRVFEPSKNTHWKTTVEGVIRLKKASRTSEGKSTISYIRTLNDFSIIPIHDRWEGLQIGQGLNYIVETSPRVVERCLLMTTDPGDLVLDPTCGSGTTAYVAEQWGRRWITVDTSRVALALSRARIMGARYPYYLLADSPEGQAKLAEVERRAQSDAPTHGDIRQGFVYERVPHITLKSIANNAEIDTIWEQKQPVVERALAELNATLKGHKTPFKVKTGGRAGQSVEFAAADGETVTVPSGEEAPVNGLLEWEVPRELPDDWPETAREPHQAFWAARIERQKEIDASIATKADHEYLYDRPYTDNSKVRVAGPFTVESISPHRSLAVDENDELIEPGLAETGPGYRYDGPEPERDFAGMVLENLKVAGVQQAHKDDRIVFTSLSGWPGTHICAEGRYIEGGGDGAGEAGAGADGAAQATGTERRAGIFIGPEFGTVSRADLVAAAREAADAGFDVLIACAFNFEAHATEFHKLGRVPVLKARMNADLHMGGDLKTTKSGNLFVVFGEPDITIEEAGTDDEGTELIRVKINGVDVFRPQTGEITASEPDEIACWFIDTDYNEESFFVRHAYFLGAQDPYKALKTTLKAEIDEEAWETLHSDVSRPFPKPSSGRIAVKVINHLGDEVMKVFGVG